MIIEGRLLHDPHEPPLPGWVRVEGATIAEIGAGAPPQRADAGGADRVICPGFIDAHVHLPQVDAVGHDGLDLLTWLDRVIYPAERQWGECSAARHGVASACRRMAAAGTLGYAGFLSSHAHALEAARGAAKDLPLRALAGQVLMDRGAPADLLGHPMAPLEDGHRLSASVNPRFGVGCSDGLLRSAGAAAERAGCMIQTHLAESPEECRAVAQLFPDDENYTLVYDRRGLLGPRTLLAHCCHLRDDEWALIARRGCVAVHCPTANTFLASGLFDLDAARAHGVRLALGSDVAAGPDLAMPRVARAMIEVAKLRRMTVAPHAHVPTPAEAWSLITAGNADALGWPDAGRITIGGAADLLVLRPPFEVDDSLIGRLIYTWRSSYIETRVVNGCVID